MLEHLLGQAMAAEVTQACWWLMAKRRHCPSRWCSRMPHQDVPLDVEEASPKRGEG